MISPNNQINNLQNMNPASVLTPNYSTNMIEIHGGREGALNYPVANGYTALLIDEENKMFFIKTNEINGVPKQMREFKYKEITPEDPSKMDTSKFATKEDFNILLNEIKKLQNNRDGGHRYNRNRPRRNDYNG